MTSSVPEKYTTYLSKGNKTPNITISQLDNRYVNENITEDIDMNNHKIKNVSDDSDVVTKNFLKSMILKKTVDISTNVNTFSQQSQFTKVLSLSKSTCIIKILFHPEKDNIKYGIDINSMFFAKLCKKNFGISDLEIYEVFEETSIQTSAINARYNTALNLNPGLWIAYKIDNYGIKQVRSNQFKLTIYYIKYQ